MLYVTYFPYLNTRLYYWFMFAHFSCLLIFLRRVGTSVPIALAAFSSMALLGLWCFRKRVVPKCKGKEEEEPYDTDTDSEPDLLEKEGEKGMPTAYAIKVEPVESPPPTAPKLATVVCIPDKQGSVETSFRICKDECL